MSETKHTPGPWHYEHPALSFSIHAAAIHVADVFAKVSGGTSDKYVLEEEADANARLIAAAPDLLKACEAALAEIESPDSYWNEEGPLAKQLRSAIQAAKEGK